ncbi:hypothetical protein KKG52_00445 [Patescibacteria group bacterium]|nr:hypothetical protein [Patescibacteria group bacterium]
MKENKAFRVRRGSSVASGSLDEAGVRRYSRAWSKPIDPILEVLAETFNQEPPSVCGIRLKTGGRAARITQSNYSGEDPERY